MTRAFSMAALLVALMGAAVQGAETFGTAPTLAEVTPLTDVIARPASFETKTVRVEGVVTAVCQMMGCWLALARDAQAGSNTLLVKVDDGVIVFPTSARGKRATVQGVVQKVGAGDAEGHEAAREHAESTGKPAAPRIIWQLKATGAIVH
jgi:hypothetical protein